MLTRFAAGSQAGIDPSETLMFLFENADARRGLKYAVGNNRPDSKTECDFR